MTQKSRKIKFEENFALCFGNVELNELLPTNLPANLVGNRRF